MGVALLSTTRDPLSVPPTSLSEAFPLSLTGSSRGIRCFHSREMCTQLPLVVRVECKMAPREL